MTRKRDLEKGEEAGTGETTMQVGGGEGGGRRKRGGRSCAYFAWRCVRRVPNVSGGSLAKERTYVREWTLRPRMHREVPSPSRKILRAQRPPTRPLARSLAHNHFLRITVTARSRRNGRWAAKEWLEAAGTRERRCHYLRRMTRWRRCVHFNS